MTAAHAPSRAVPTRNTDRLPAFPDRGLPAGGDGALVAAAKRRRVFRIRLDARKSGSSANLSRGRRISMALPYAEVLAAIGIPGGRVLI